MSAVARDSRGRRRHADAEAMVTPARPHRRSLLSIFLAVVGLGAIVWLVRDTGPRRLLDTAVDLAGYWPLVLLMEGARIAADATVSWSVYGERRGSLRPGKLMHASLIAYPANLLLPAGRIGSEALRAAMIRHEVGLTRATTAAVLQQAFPLLAGAVIAVPCGIAGLWVWGPTWLSFAVMAQAATAVALSGFILFTVQRPTLGKLVDRISARLGAATAEVQADLRAVGISRRTFALAVFARILLGAQIIVLAYAVDVPRGFVGGLLTLGVHLVGLMLGDLIPAQLGTTDGMLAFGAEPLGVVASSLVVVALMFHASQLAWAAVGAVAALFPPKRPD